MTRIFRTSSTSDNEKSTLPEVIHRAKVLLGSAAMTESPVIQKPIDEAYVAGGWNVGSMESPEDRAGSSPRGTCCGASSQPERMPGHQPGIRIKVVAAQSQSLALGGLKVVGGPAMRAPGVGAPASH